MNKISIPEGTDTKFFFLGEGILTEVLAGLEEAFPGERFWVVADENTWAVAGKAVAAILRAAGRLAAEPYIYPGHPIMHASEELAQGLLSRMPGGCIPVAVGSGTINDLVKRASGLKGVHYCCIATACSVDGYTASGAALLVNGFKKTMPCPPPYAIIADSKVLATAPAPMFAAGYADLLAKVYGGADWTIADELGIEPIDATVWTLVQKDLRAWLSEGGNMGNIFHGLCNTGYSIQMYHDSRPASGAEHLFSHIWEMERLLFNGESVSHGFQVGIGMLLSAQLMGFIVNTPRADAEKLSQPLQSREERRSGLDRLLVKGCYGAAGETAMEKFLEGDEGLRRRQLIFGHWEAMRRRIKEQYIPTEELRNMLKAVHCPSSYPEIGLSYEQFIHAVHTAQLIRKRYTVLDALYECGLLNAAVATIEK